MASQIYDLQDRIAAARLLERAAKQLYDESPRKDHKLLSDWWVAQNRLLELLTEFVQSIMSSSEYEVSVKESS